ncbi:MAG TPA: hypothetical protein VGL23_04445 [Chloroflexota bacterium]
MPDEWIARGLVALVAVGVLAQAAYFVGNRVLRAQIAAARPVDVALDVAVGTVLFAGLVPLGLAAGLAPLVHALFLRPAVVPDAEDVVYVAVLLAAVAVGMAGCGMHAAGRSIDARLGLRVDGALRRTVGWFHGPLGHHPLHACWALATAALALLCAAHPGAAPGPAWLPLVGAVGGLIRTASVLEGGSARYALPVEAAATAFVGWRLAAIGATPEALFFAAGLAAGAAALAAWGCWHRGFPRPTAPRCAPASAADPAPPTPVRRAARPACRHRRRAPRAA